MSLKRNPRSSAFWNGKPHTFSPTKQVRQYTRCQEALQQWRRRRLVRRRLRRTAEVRSGSYTFATRRGLQRDIRELPRLTRHLHSGPGSPGGRRRRLRGLLRCPELRLRLLRGLRRRWWTRIRCLL